MRVIWLIAVGAILCFAVTVALLVKPPERCVAFSQLEILLRSVQNWREVRGSYPESIAVMVGASHPDTGLDRVPLDPFGNEYEYRIRDGKPQIACLGSDGKVGGTGEARDWVWPQDRREAMRQGFFPRVLDALGF